MISAEEYRRTVEYILLNDQMLMKSLNNCDLHHAAQAMQNTADLLSVLGMSSASPLTSVVKLKLRVDELLNKMTSERALFNYVIKKDEEEK
ncbi:hypothetical protein [Lactobacillus johnsonii]|uniref:hypothetical protein n=1 Tax=Lactobacillus johnsonii TaxID=33959 RepID=UPI0018A0E5DD|nr:hypothetical protein [Lactobacillus johnsonii]